MEMNTLEVFPAGGSTKSWMLYGAAGYTGTLVAQHAYDRGHRPLLAGRSAPALATLADSLQLPYRVFGLDDPSAVIAGLADVDLVLNVAGPFLHTAAALAHACLIAGVHYIDISNELQVFRTLYDLHHRAEHADVTVVPGVGFGVVATNCLARHVSDAVGGAQHLAVATRAATLEAGPGVAATRLENLPFGGWDRQDGQLRPLPLGTGTITIEFPDGPGRIMPLPTGDLEAAFRATGAPDIIAYSAIPDPAVTQGGGPGAGRAGPKAYRSFGWARASSAAGVVAEAWLETGESYAFTAASSIRAVEETLARAGRGALSPAQAFGADFVLTIQDTARVDDHLITGGPASGPSPSGRTFPVRT
jgi:short subunit dehydrogenase-like uncharacterized protein